MIINSATHRLARARFLASPHADARPQPAEISLLVIHGISLPDRQFGTPFIDDLFMGTLDPLAGDGFAELAKLRVSAHCVIRRRGQITQYVPFHLRAWHAGVSVFQGRQRCNDFSIGIELEGTDEIAYTQAQYRKLAALTRALMRAYPAITAARIVGHADIAPGRKTDPGAAFDWPFFRQLLHKR